MIYGCTDDLEISSCTDDLEMIDVEIHDLEVYFCGTTNGQCAEPIWNTQIKLLELCTHLPCVLRYTLRVHAFCM